ncbi:jg14109 [Pararge aegeria aegeria]|uniref:Jg14109 protein n=1 Tax=Pararge aegeria aegeria TaxID=348720 RepID=A0A8S4RWJ8_9NEOP|nr:jg14109 [Pararge aegeria aegeria]
MDSTKFSTFFGNVPTFTIPGRTFPVENFFAKNVCEDYVDGAVKQTEKSSLSSVLLYGVEAWTLTETMSRKLEAFEMWVYRRMLRISWTDRVRNSTVLQRMETSLTVDGIMYVIDCGYCKLKVYNPRIGMDALQVSVHRYNIRDAV